MLVTCAYLTDAQSPWVLQSLFLAAIGECRDRGLPALETFGYRYPPDEGFASALPRPSHHLSRRLSGRLRLPSAAQRRAASQLMSLDLRAIETVAEESRLERLHSRLLGDQRGPRWRALNHSWTIDEWQIDRHEEGSITEHLSDHGLLALVRAAIERHSPSCTTCTPPPPTRWRCGSCATVIWPQTWCRTSFLAIWKQASNFDSSRGQPSSWILTLTHHKAVDIVRREERRRAESMDETRDAADPGAGVDEQAWQRRRP